MNHITRTVRAVAISFPRLLPFSVTAMAAFVFMLFTIHASSTVAATDSESRATAMVCIDDIAGPSTQDGFKGCFEPSALAFRSARDEDRLAMAVAMDQVEVFRRHLSDSDPSAAHEVHVCIFEGVNICFEEKLEIVWVCITTGQLAGYECPDLNGSENAAVIGFAGAQSP